MRKLRGFTLIELMVTIAIVAILTTIAAPSFKQLIQSNTMSSNVNTFLADMRFARSEAIRRGGNVVMCRSDLPEAAIPVCNNLSGIDGNGWVSGWIIFHDITDSPTVRDSTDPIIRVQAAIKSIDSIVEQKASPTARFHFTATGRLQNLTSATQLQFGGSNFSNESQRVVCVSVGGRARIAGDGLTSCGTSFQ